jgi:long-chain-fatty-acid--CoA ligase ACSBG
MITHDNLISEAYMAGLQMPGVCVKEEEERVLSYLPLSHVAGMLVDIIMPLAMTATRPGWQCASFARPYDLKVGSVGDRLRAVRPTLFLGVPRVWEKVAEKMKAVGASTTGLKKTLSTWAKGKSLEHQMNCQLGGDGSAPFGHGLASVLLNKVRGVSFPFFLYRCIVWNISLSFPFFLYRCIVWNKSLSFPFCLRCIVGT